MAIGKNKRLTKAGRKGSKKKVVDAFARKEHYIVKGPSYFNVVNVANTIASKSVGLKKSEDSLKGRIYTINMADLQRDEGQGHRKVHLVCEDIQGRNCITDFHGLSITRDYLCSQIRKRHSLIEAHVDLVTVDNFHLRMFCLGFTKEMPSQKKTNSYAKSSQIRAIRARMVKIMQQEASKCQLKTLVKKLIPEVISKKIEKSCSQIYPLHGVIMSRVKVIKKPKLDMARLMAVHETAAENLAETEMPEARNLLAAELADQ